jgi:hypothetical protein
MALKVDHVRQPLVIAAAEKMIESDFVERCQ